MPPIAAAFDGTTAMPPPPPLLPPTLMETSVTQMPPWLFHIFTCNVCQPLGAVTGPLMYQSFQAEVCVLSSSEYPTPVTGREEHESAHMLRVKGEETPCPLVGLTIVVCASAGTVRTASIAKI